MRAGPRTLATVVGLCLASLLSTPSATAIATRPASGGPVTAAVSAARPTAPSARVARQLWVWRFSSPTALVQLARRNHVTILLVWVSPGFSTDTASLHRLSDLRRRAAAAGIRVDALGGDPSWLSYPSVALAWAREVRRTGLFAHVHLDVEPPRASLLSAPPVAGQLLRVLSRVRTAGLPVDADVAYWFWQVRTAAGERLDEAVLRRVDSITIMAYQSSPGRVVSVARQELAAAARLHRRAFVGVNIGSPGGDSPLSTFAGQPDAAVRSALASIDRSCAATSACAGTAVHHAADLGRLTKHHPLAQRAARRR